MLQALVITLRWGWLAVTGTILYTALRLPHARYSFAGTSLGHCEFVYASMCMTRAARSRRVAFGTSRNKTWCSGCA